MSAFDLAQFNIATVLAPLDDPRMEGFVSRLAEINAVADNAPGFVWRLQTDDGDATALRPCGDDVVVNLSVWKDAASLKAFTYRAGHAELLRDRGKWFARAASPTLVMWWVPAGHRPSVAEAIARLEDLRKNGPSPLAFDFRNFYPPPESGGNA